MKLFQEGEKSRAICEPCDRLVTTRFERRTVELKNPPVAVPDVLVAVCEVCNEIAAIPHQSTPRLQEARRQSAPKHEARIPALLNDAIGLIATRFAARGPEFGGMLVRFYLQKMSADRWLANRIKAAADLPLARGKGTERIALRLSRSNWDHSWAAARSVGIRNTSDLFRGAMTLAAIDSGITISDALVPSRAYKRAIEAIAMAAPDAPECIPG